MKIFKQSGKNKYLIDGHIYLALETYCIDLTVYYGVGNEPQELNDSRIQMLVHRNRAEDLLWPDVEIPYNAGDYYDANREKREL